MINPGGSEFAASINESRVRGKLTETPSASAVPRTFEAKKRSSTIAITLRDMRYVVAKQLINLDLSSCTFVVSISFDVLSPKAIQPRNEVFVVWVRGFISFDLPETKTIEPRNTRNQGFSVLVSDSFANCPGFK